VIRDVLKPEWTAVYLLDEDEVRLERAGPGGAGIGAENLALRSPLAERAAAMKSLVFRDELAGQAAGAEVLLEMTSLNSFAMSLPGRLRAPRSCSK